MGDLNYDDMPTADLLKKLSDGEFAHHFEASEDWKLFRAGCDYLAMQAEHKMKFIDPIKDPTGIIETQITAKICRNVLKAIISGLKNEGRIAFDELMDRGVSLPGLSKKRSSRRQG